MRSTSRVLALVWVLLLMVSCIFAPAGGTGPEVTDVPALPVVTDAPATEPPEGWGSVSVVNSTMYQDNWGDTMIVGMIYNGTNEAITDIKLILRAADSAGNTVLQRYPGSTNDPVDELEVSRYKSDMVPEMIPAGGYAPFAKVVNTGKPATFSIEVNTYQSFPDETVEVRVENAQLLYDGDGNFFIAGEVVNTGPAPVRILGVTGAVLDDSGAVWGAAEAWAYGGYLLPAGDPSGLDRAPFSMNIFGPFTAYTGFSVHPAAVVEGLDDETAYTAEVTHTFVDSIDQFHMIGQVTSHTGTQVAAPEVLGVLYDENGLVIDVTRLYCFPALHPGETGFVDISTFKVIDAMPELAGQVASTRLQINPENVNALTDSNPLEVRGVTREYQDFGPSWYFTGSVVNTTGVAIDDAIVAVAVYDADGILVGAYFAYLSKSGDIPAGGSETFDLYVTLDPALDPSTLTYELVAWDD